MSIDNFEEPATFDPTDEYYTPTSHEIAEYAMQLMIDLEEVIDWEEDPTGQTITGSLDAGALLSLVYYALQMYEIAEDLSESDMETLEDYVRIKKHYVNTFVTTLH